MLNREIRSRLDLINETDAMKLPQKETNSNIKVREFCEGDRVACRDYLHDDKWEFGEIYKRLGKLHYTIRLDDNRIWKRHVDQIRLIGKA